MELIEQGKLYDCFTDNFCDMELITLDNALRLIEDAPVIDAAPVVHGWWGAYMPVLGAGDLQIRCSECGLTHDVRTRYCPNCGARMGGEDDG